MKIKNEVDSDIFRFFEQIENQGMEDKRKTLKLLIDKYAHLSTSNYLLNDKDLFDIISTSKSIFSKKTFPVFLGENSKRVLECNQATICIIEATISHLNNKECLSKLAKFDYRQNKF